MWHERFDLIDNFQLNFEYITGFSKRSIFNICWSNSKFNDRFRLPNILCLTAAVSGPKPSGHYLAQTTTRYPFEKKQNPNLVLVPIALLLLCVNSVPDSNRWLVKTQHPLKGSGYSYICGTRERCFQETKRLSQSMLLPRVHLKVATQHLSQRDFRCFQVPGVQSESRMHNPQF